MENDKRLELNEQGYPKIENANKIIKEKTNEKAYELYGKDLPQNIRNRIELELNTIINNNYASIYLIYSDLVKKSNEWGDKVGFRGCIGNSFVAYLLEITNINPIKYNLPFEVFVGINYDKEQDIDLNVSVEIREKLIEYLQTKFDTKGNGDTTNICKSIKLHDDLTMIHELEKLTKIDSDTIDLEDSETLSIFSNDNDTMTTIGISEFGTEYARNILEKTKPKNFNDLVCISALSHGTGTWGENADILVEDGKCVDEVISNRDDVYNYIVSNGIDDNTAYEITKFIRCGKAKRKINSNIKENIRKLYNNQWKEYCNIMKEHNIPQWYIESAEKIGYLFPKAHAISNTSNAFKIAWYKVHYPKAFYDTYFKVMSDLNVKDYNCKRVIKQDLDIQYNKLSYPDDYEDYNGVAINYKIRGLEILFEAYELGVYEENEI